MTVKVYFTKVGDDDEFFPYRFIIEDTRKKNGNDLLHCKKRLIELYKSIVFDPIITFDFKFNDKADEAAFQLYLFSEFDL